MLKRKKISLVIFLFILSLTIFSAYIYGSSGRFDEFSGTGHTGCHNAAVLSSSGYFDVVLSSGNTVETDEVFTISLTVRSFTEANGQDLSLGFADLSPRGDNALWQTDGGSFDVKQYDSVNIDGSGDSSGYIFTLTAPPSTASYTLIADAVYDNPSGGGADDLIYITTNIALTVVPADSSPPSIAITAPSNNAFVSGASVAITATVDDGAGVGVDQVWAEITNATYSENVTMSGTEPNYSGTWDSTVVFDGTYTLAIKGNDTAGNLNNTESITIKVDNTAPSITIDSVIPNPSNGIIVITAGNSTEIIDGNGIMANVSLPSGGYIYPTMTYQGSNKWNGTFDVSLYSDGTFNVRVNGTDLAGNTGYAGPTAVTGDTANPTIVINSPNSSNAFNSTAPNFSVTISDTNLDVQWYTIDSGITNNTFVGSTGTIDQTLWDAKGNESVTLTFYANDTASNEISASVTIIKDILAPSISITIPSTNDLIGPTAPNYSLSITEGNLDSIWYSLNGGTTNSSVVGASGTINQGLWDAANNGTVTITFWANDTVGNTGTNSVDVQLDDTAPIITISTPIINDLIGPTAPSYSLSITEGNLDSIWYSLNGGTTNSSVVGASGTINQGLWDAANNGTVTITFWANDTLGNLGMSTVDVELDDTAPIITITTPSTNDLIGPTAPSYSLSITEGNLDSIWYSLNGGTTNSSVVGASGTIYQALWDAANNGTVTITFWANDTLGNLGMSTVDVELDETAPIITITTPNLNDLIGPTAPGYSLSITEGNLDSIWYSLNGGITNSSVVGASGTINQAIWDAANNGTVTITFWANDTLGNLGMSTVDVELDDTAPLITINSPNTNDLFGNSAPSYSLSITEGNLDSIWYSLNGGITNSSVVGASGTINQVLWDAESNGTLTIIFWVNDTLGNLAFDSVNVIKEIILPIVNITNPSPDGAQISGSAISISGNADGTGSTIVSIFINDTRWGDGTLRPQTDPSGSMSGTFIFNNRTIITPGFYWVEINITDSAGNVNSSIRYFQVVSGDSTPPILTITSITPDPTNGYVEIIITSNEALSALPLLNITLPNSTVVFRPMTLISPLTWSANYTVDADGTFSIKINGTDGSGNTGYVSNTFEGDLTDPIININNPIPSELFGVIAPNFNLTIVEINFDSIWYTLDNGLTNTSAPGTIGTINQGLWDALLNGTVTIRFYTNDTAGNLNYSEITVRIDNTDPAVTILTPNLNDLIGISAPTYSLSITEPNLDSIWYSLNGGITNSSVVGASGTINQA
ncbi:MAG: beta strand repeat-containing protein [Promethearchaeota archaeon]